MLLKSSYARRVNTSLILEAFDMSKYFLPRPLRGALMSLLIFVSCASQSLSQTRHHGKIFGGYFEEWGIRYAHYNIADLEKNILAILRGVFDVFEITYHDPAQLKKGDDAGGDA